MAGPDWQHLFPADLNSNAPAHTWPEIFPRQLSSVEPVSQPQTSNTDSALWAELAKATDPRYERPRARPGVKVERLPKDGGAILWYDDGDKEGAYVQLAPQDLFLWERMDGKRSQVDLVVDYCLQYKTLATARVAALVEQLREQKLLAEPADELYPKLAQYLQSRTFSGVINSLLQTFLQREFAVSGIDNLLSRFYRGGVWLLYTRPAQLLCWVLALSGLITYILLLFSGKFSGLGEGAGGALTLLLCQIVALFQHEMGHAFTVKAFGRRVRRAGILLMYGLPGAFVDTTDIWPAGRRAQLWVTWAGPFSNLVNGGFLALLVALNPSASYAPFLFQFALAHYLLVAFNLTPFLRLDGYYLLADWLQVANLRPRSMGFLRNGLPHLMREAWKEGRILPHFSREQLILTIFGGVCTLWITNLLALAVVSAPIRVFDTIGFLAGGKAAANPVATFFILLGVLFAFLMLIRGITMLRNWLSKLQLMAQRAPAWRTAALFALLALLIALVPTVLLIQNAARTSRIYGHGLALITDGLIILVAVRLAGELRGATLRRGLLGMTGTGLILLGIDGYATLYALLPDLFTELPRWFWLLGLLPVLVMAFPIANTLAALRRAALGFAVGLNLVAIFALIIAALTNDTFGNPLILAGHTFFLAGLILHWQLVRRPLRSPRTIPLTYSEEATDLLASAVAVVAGEQAQVLGEIAGKPALLKFAMEFNGRAASANWPLWFTMDGHLGDKTSGSIEERAAIYRAALHELRSQIAANYGAAFSEDAQAQSLAELPRPLRAVFQRWISLGGQDTDKSGETIQIVDDDRVRLRLAGRRVAETLAVGCARSYGWLLTERALAGFNRSAALAHWPLYLRANGRITDEFGTASLLDISRVYTEALQDLLGRIAEITGISFVERGLTQVYDNLSWEMREVATNSLFERLTWAQHLTLVKQADNRTTFLGSIPLLSWMAPGDLSTLSERLTSRRVRSGKVVIAPDTYLTHAMIVRHGTIQVVQTVEGVRQVLEQIGTGGIIGVRSLLEDQPVPHEYLAQTDLELWQVPREVVEQQLGPLLHLQGTLDEERAKLGLLGRIPLFAALEAEQRAAVAQALEVQQLSPGRVVLQAGQESQGLFIVRVGELDVLAPAANGEEYRVSVLGPGEFFGESALLSRGKVTATVRAASEVELLRLPPDQFYTLLATSLSAPLAQVQSRRAEERARMAQMAKV